MGNDKFSIIVPTRNRKKQLIELIKTINLEDKNLNEFSKRLILASNLWSPSSIIISNKTLPIF